jgi:hypothetical protein
MSKRVLLWVGVLAVLAAVGMAGVRWLYGPGVSWANYQRIEVGMPRSEVRKMLGRAGEKIPFWGTVGVRAEFECWDGITGEISVFFDKMDQVEMKDWRDKPLLSRLRSMVGL